jgi:hypothetical protein
MGASGFAGSVRCVNTRHGVAILAAVHLEEPVERVALVGDEPVQARRRVVVRPAHPSTLPPPARAR